jgi:hypothetical protein
LILLVKVREYSSYDIENSFEKSIEDNAFDFKIQAYSALGGTSKIPKIQAATYISRRAGYYIINAFFLIFLITVSTLTLFSIQPKVIKKQLILRIF